MDKATAASQVIVTGGLLNERLLQSMISINGLEICTNVTIKIVLLEGVRVRRMVYNKVA